MPANSRDSLIRKLQDAYSGELAAAYAYRGHAMASKDPTEKIEILKIKQDEWEHRQCIGTMLTAMNAKPRLSRELLMNIIGVTIYCLCRLGGWFNVFNFGWYMSMYGAGKLEQGNIVEYEVAALNAKDCDESRFIPELIHMAEVEWDHELYFRSKALTSRWSKYLKIWQAPPPRITARQRIEQPGLAL